MPRYVVERTFPAGLHIPVTDDGAQTCLAVVGSNADEGVTGCIRTSATTSTRPSAYTTRRIPRRSARRRIATRCPSTRSRRSASSTRTSTAEERGNMIKLILRAVALLVPVSLLVAPVTQASSQASLADVRHATAKFHDVGKAEHAGYQRLLNCFDLPGTGGMGQHYVNLNLLDAAVTPGEPEAMVYEVDGDRLQ